MKMAFELPSIAIIRFESADIITSSQYNVDMPDDDIWNPSNNIYFPEDDISE